MKTITMDCYLQMQAIIVCGAFSNAHNFSDFEKSVICEPKRIIDSILKNNDVVVVPNDTGIKHVTEWAL